MAGSTSSGVVPQDLASSQSFAFVRSMVEPAQGLCVGSRPAEYVRFYDEAPPPVITPLDVQERVPAGILGVFGQ